jgi:hypothetical protein
MLDADPLRQILRAVSYPYHIPCGPFMLTGAGCLPLNLESYALLKHPRRSDLMPGKGDVQSFLEVMEAGDRLGKDLLPVLAARSNASPEQLGRKLAGNCDFAIPLLHGHVRGWSSVYSGHVTRYGAVPATLFQDTHATTRLHCLLIPRRLLRIFNESEGPQYKLQTLPGVSFFTVGLETGEQTEIVEPLAYISLRFSSGLSSGLSFAGPLRLARLHTEGSEFASASEVQALTLLHAMTRQTTSVCQFIHRLVGDGQFRNQCNDYIAANLTHEPLLR